MSVPCLRAGHTLQVVPVGLGTCLQPQEPSSLSWPSLQQHFIHFAGSCTKLNSNHHNSLISAMDWLYEHPNNSSYSFPWSVLTLRQIILPIRDSGKGDGVFAKTCLSSSSQYVQQVCCGSWPAVQNLLGGITLSIILNVKGIKYENKRHFYLRDDHGEGPIELVGVLWHMVLPVQKCLSAYLSYCMGTRHLPPAQCELAQRIWSWLND